MKSRFELPIVAALSVALAATTQAHAAEQWGIGTRAGIAISGGKPANDIEHTGLFGTYALSPGSRVGISADWLVYDFEGPWAVVGVQQDTAITPKIIDAKVKSTLVSAFYEQNYGARTERWNWNWRAGLGFAKPKAPNVSGPATGGGTFTMSTDAGTETVLSGGASVRYNVSPSVSFDLGGTLRHHRAKWKITDTVSGRTGTVKSYSSIGVEAGLGIRF
ncbi:MAG: hypothetical protein JNN03_00220 [Rubrivivax sp.]|nr:hypothetical protein [Rubrivivax sp.]